MTSLHEDINNLAQRCYVKAVNTGRPSRTVAIDLVTDLADGRLLRALAAEFLVDAVAKAARARTLEQERMAESQRQQQLNESANSPRGVARRQQAESEDVESFRRTWDEIRSTLDRYTAELKVEWTADLLDATFALGDGTQVTWGEATISQHEERRELFLRNAHGNMEGAARHDFAIKALAEAGQQTLRQLVLNPAA